MSKKLCAAAALMSVGLMSSVAHAQMPPTNEEIQMQMKSMMDRITALEQENQALKASVAAAPAAPAAVPAAPAPATGAAPAPAPATASAPGTVTLPGTGTTLKFGGYVKADAIADIGTGYGADFAQFGAIPLDNSATAKKSGDFLMHARQSRFNVLATTPSPVGDVKAFAEVDFFGTRGTDLITNGSSPELRQAYGQVGGLLAGQAWSNFVDLDAMPESLDYVGPAGVTILRQVQVRYTGKILDSGVTYGVSAENPFTDFTNGGAHTVTTYEHMPDVTVALTDTGDWGHVSLRGVARDISVRDETSNTAESDFGYGVSLTSTLNTFDKDNLKFRLSYGDGIGRYIYDDAVSSKGAAYNGSTLETQSLWSGYAAYQLHWTDTLRSNLMGGYTAINNDTALLGTGQNKTIWSGHANLIWEPAKAYKVGIEYMHGYRELDSGLSGTLDRVQTSFIYALN